MDVAELGRISRETVMGLIAPGARNISIIDPPDYPNVGDSALFIGEITLMNDCIGSPRYSIIDRKYYMDAARNIASSSDYITFIGGGNFGDLWPEMHQFRLQIMREFPDIPKIQFPQSICFQNDGALEETKRVIGGQKSFVLLVRDHNSLDFARKMFDCETHLCPDMAFSIGAIPARSPECDVLMLLRDDKEKAFGERAALTAGIDSLDLTHRSSDWVSDQETLIQKADRFLSRRGCGRIGSLPGYSDLAFAVRLKYAHARLNHGIALLSSGHRVVTDRLHGMILATLIGRDVIVFDSLDSKVRSFHETWLGGSTTTRFVQSSKEAIELLRQGARG